jgi:hypothetical protein
MPQPSWAPTETGNKLSQRAVPIFSSEGLLWTILFIGIVLRVERYLFNRSLWLDEAALALNILNRSFSELLRPLDYNQGAPIGFLMVEGLFVQAWGDSEYVLRLFPLIAGIASLFLFYRVASYFIDAKAIPIALGLFGISEPLIYYSSEVKQYSSDVAIVLLLYWIYSSLPPNRPTIRGPVLLGIAGAIAIWFSHPSVFILAGLGASVAIFAFVRKDWERLGRFFIAYLLWTVSFTFCYFVSLSHLSKNQALLNFWSNDFMPFQPLLFAQWFHNSFFGIFGDPVGLSLLGMAAFAFLTGGVSVFRKDPERFFMLISPVLIALFVSGFHKYPFGGRLLLFVVPIVLLLIGEGAGQITDRTSPHSPIVGILFIGLLFYHPFVSATYYLFKPRMNEEIKPVIRYLKEHQKNGDVLYLYYASHLAFKYYQKRYGYEDDDYVVGVVSRGNVANYREELNRLRGNERVWILFSHVSSEGAAYEQAVFLEHLDRMGTRADVFKSEGASVYLYDLSS